MALGWCSARARALGAALTVGLGAAAYGCGSSSRSDFEQTPPGTGGTHAGTAGRAGADTAGKAGAPSAGGSGGDVTTGSGGSGAGTELGGGGGAGGTGGTGNGKAGASSGGSSARAGASGSSSTGGAGAAGEGGEAGEAGEANGGEPACNPDDTSVPFKTRCLACATDTCGTCLCNDCTQKLETCQNTPGCQDVADCVIASGCNSEACYCGGYALSDCLSGQADGPCKAVMLNAPGGHEPSIGDISAGPATDAALAVGLCAISGGPCADECM
jgi:hypothetical protein